MRVRQGNDFIFLWAIERNGEPEDLSNAVNIKLHFKNFDRVSEVKSFQIVDGNIVRVEVSPEWASRLGAYSLILSYAFEDESLADNDRKCVVDVLAFNIVSKTSEADDVSEMAKTTDIMIGLRGLSAYEVWLKDNPGKTKEDYFAYLQKPATDAIGSIQAVEQTISENEGLRVSAESERALSEATRIQSENERLSAEIIRQSNEVDRIENETTRVQNEAERISKENVRQSNEIDRIEAEGLRVQAESERAQAESERQATIQEAVTATNLANEKANLANVAAQNANEATLEAQTATQEATTAASLADTARLAIQDDLALKANQTDLEQLESEVKETAEKPTAQSLSELNARITALEAILTNKIKDRIDVTKEFNVWGKTNLILYGDGASTKTPDFIGQTYIDTTNGSVYIAVGNSNAGNWKLV